MRWISFIIGLVVGIGCVFAAVSIDFDLGFAPVATHAAPMPFETSFAKAALRSAANSGAKDESPLSPNQENLIAGARTYRSHCAMCHSLPGRDKTDVQRGEYPHPPELLTGEGVIDDPVGRTHWVVHNGIRMSGMPSFEGALSGDQMWQVSLLLANANHLPQAVEQLLNAPDTVLVGENRQNRTPRTASR